MEKINTFTFYFFRLFGLFLVPRCHMGKRAHSMFNNNSNSNRREEEKNEILETFAFWGLPDMGGWNI